MPVFVEDPAHLSKSRLRSDLLAHNVRLPPAKSKKEVYVELHLKHIDQKHAADFSSEEEEDEVHDVAVEAENAAMPDLSGLTDDDLKAALLKHGVKAGPIVASTRSLYEKKLSKLLQSDGRDQINRAEKGVLYSDSEEEEEDGEEEDAESDSEEEKEETVEQSDQAQLESSQIELYSQNGSFAYPQCFLPPSRLQVRASKNGEPKHPEWNSRNALKSSERSRSRCSQIPVGISRASSVDQHSGLGSGVPSGSQLVMARGCSSVSSQAFSITQMMESRQSLSSGADIERELNGSNVQKHWSQSSGLDESVVENCTVKNQSLYYTPKASLQDWRTKEPVEITFKDMFPDAETTPAGICVTRRRPIKGAAGRPVQFAYPDSPVSPMTLERREVVRRLVPANVQFLVFIIVACILYLIYICVEDSSFSSFMDSLNQGSDSEEGLFASD